MWTRAVDSKSCDVLQFTVQSKGGAVYIIFDRVAYTDRVGLLQTNELTRPPSWRWYSTDGKWDYPSSYPSPGDSSGALGFFLIHVRRLYAANFFPFCSQAGGNVSGLMRGVVVPHWFLALAAAVLPVAVFARWWKRRRRLKRSLCLRCGYDLRASPDRCPECGTVPGKEE